MFFANDVIIAGEAYNEYAITLGIKPINGQWTTFDGEPLPYINWNSGQPTGGSNNNLIAVMSTKQRERAYLNYPAGTWHDYTRSHYSMLCTYEPSIHGQIL